MKHQGLKKVAIPILVFVIVLLLPLIINAILIYAQSKNGVKEIHTLNLEFWYDVVAIAIPSFLTLLVLLQSEEQQQVNEKIQKRMERINERMLNSELKAHLGYFLPEIDEAGIGGKIIPVRHNLHNRIDLIHSDGLLALLEFPNKTKSQTRAHGKFLLRQTRRFSILFYKFSNFIQFSYCSFCFCYHFIPFRV